MSFFLEEQELFFLLSIQYQMDFCKFGVNLIGGKKSRN